MAGNEQAIKEAMEAAREELKDYGDIPEHYGVVLKYPNMESKGVFSEIDMDMEARMRRCDIYAQRKSIYEQALYDHVKQEVLTKGDGLKKQVQEISKQHRILTRAARLCKDEESKKEILERAEKLKEADAVKQYNYLLDGLECYAGARHYKMSDNSIGAFEEHLGFVTDGETFHAGVFGDGNYFERPDSIKINLRDMDQFMEQIVETHPAVKGKTAEEKKRFNPKQEVFYKTVNQYAKDACEDTLASCYANMEERLDLLMINGMTLREMIEEKEGLKNPTKEQVTELSCNYVTAALRSGGRVETFMVETDGLGKKKFYGEPVPITGSKPKERVTLSFWESWLSKLGFFKEKVNQFKEQEKMDKKMADCRKRVIQKVGKKLTPEEIKEGKRVHGFSDPMTKEEKKEYQVGRQFAKEHLDDFVKAARLKERIEGEKLKLTYSFFPEEKKTRKGVEIRGVDILARDKPLYYCVSLMLEKGIPYEEVLDPTKHQDLRVEIGNYLKETIPTMSSEDFDKLHIDSMKRLAKEMDGFAKKMSKEIKTTKDISDKFPELYVGTISATVLGMDNFQDKNKAIAYCGGQKEFDNLRLKLAQTDNIYSMVDMQNADEQKYYQVLRGRDLKMTTIMKNMMQKTAILQGLSAKEPSFNPALDTADNYVYNAYMQFHPEVINLQERADKMDKALIHDLLATGGENQAHMKFEIMDKEMPNQTPIGPYAKNEVSLRVNVIINDKKLTELDSPVLEEERSL